MVYSLRSNWLRSFRQQVGFRPGDSTVMQLVYIVHKIYEALEKGSEMRAVFLDISKAFDRVWHRGLIAKLRSIGVEGSLLNWFTSYLSCRKQRVIMEGVHSDWCNIEAGVPQGSVFGHYCFLFILMIFQPLSLLIVFYLLMIVFCWKKSSLLVIVLLNLIMT